MDSTSGNGGLSGVMQSPSQSGISATLSTLGTRSCRWRGPGYGIWVFARVLRSPEGVDPSGGCPRGIERWYASHRCGPAFARRQKPRRTPLNVQTCPDPAMRFRVQKECCHSKGLILGGCQDLGEGCMGRIEVEREAAGVAR